MKNRKRESCTSGTVRDEDGNILIYSARPHDGGAAHTGGRRTQTFTISDVPVTNSRPVFSGPMKVLVVMRASAATKLAAWNQGQGQALSALKSLRPQQGVEQVTQQAGSDEGGE
jgi:hypothetical protein